MLELSFLMLRPNKKISGFWVTVLKNLSRDWVGTHIFFFGKKCNFMHFKRHFEMPFKIHKILFLSRKPEKILGFARKF